MTFVYGSKLRKANIVYDKEVGLQHEIEQAFQSQMKRSYHSSPRSSPDSTQFCCSCMEIIGGRLYNCSRCNSSFHSICHFPSLPINHNKESWPSDWLCHRCETEVQYNRRHLPRIKCNSDSHEKEDALNQSFIRFLLRLSGKDGAPSEDFSEFVNSLKAINSREFTLEKLCIDECYYKLPFDEIFSNSDVSSSKKCFYCKRYMEKKMICCDFCDTSFCLDCPNPPFTALPNERFMCSLHIEPFIDANLLSSKRVTDRMALWDKYTKLPKSNSSFSSVISSFCKKIGAENTKQFVKLEPTMTKMRKKSMKDTFKVQSMVKKAYALAEERFTAKQQNCREETPIDVGSPDDARLSIAVEALIKMHNQTEDFAESNFSHNFTAFATKPGDLASGVNHFADTLSSEIKSNDRSLKNSFNPSLLNRTLPIFAALKILSGDDKNILYSDFLIPIHSTFVTLGPLKVNSLHNIDLSQFTHCKVLGKHQALVFFDKAKQCFEVISANFFADDTFSRRKCSQQARLSADFISDCACQRTGVDDQSTLWLLDSTLGIVPSRKSAVLWNGAIIRIGCLRLHFVGLGIM